MGVILKMHREDQVNQIKIIDVLSMNYTLILMMYVCIYVNYVRKNALNKFKPEYCERILKGYLDPMRHKVEDSKNIYYKKVE